MPTEVQFRRGTTAQNNAFTGAAGELSVNNTNNSVRVHDGSTAGGFELAKADLSNTSGLGTVAAANIGIGTTPVVVISSGFELQNIQSLDATTTATIEAAIATGDNDFTSLNISGIGTVIGEFNVGTGGTVLTALSQVGISSVGIASAIPTATLDVLGTAKISSTLTAANSAVELNTSGINVTGIVTATRAKVGVVTFIDSGIYTPNGIVTATHFSGELVGTSVTTRGGLHQNTGIATISQIVGNIEGQVLSGIATVDAKLNITGIATFSSSTEFAGLSTFYSNARFLDNVKGLFGNGGDLEIYHDGSNSYVSDTGGGDLILDSNSNLTLRKSSVGVATAGSAFDIIGGTSIGPTGIATFPQIKVGAAVTIGAYGLNISGGVHINTAGIATAQRVIIGAAVTAADSGLDALNVNVGTALTVVGVSTFSGQVNVGVDTSVGVIMTASNGTRYRLIVEDDGSLSTVALS